MGFSNIDDHEQLGWVGPDGRVPTVRLADDDYCQPKSGTLAGSTSPPAADPPTSKPGIGCWAYTCIDPAISRPGTTPVRFRPLRINCDCRAAPRKDD
jgi:hypothetical protein